MNSKLRANAQDTILHHAVAAALVADESGNRDLGEMIRQEASKIAKRWKIKNVSGLPDTFRD